MTGPQPDVLRLRDLAVSFPSGRDVVRAVNTVSLTVKQGEIVGLIGETGCGKTVLGLAIMRLLQPDTRISGEIIHHGVNLLTIDEEEMRQTRGGGVAMVLQNSGSSLNPVVTVGRQIAEAVSLHRGCAGDTARAEAVRLLGEVGIPEPETRYDRYPHEFSGGMKERVMIAIALAGDPSFLIADEPTTGLDTPVKNRIVSLLQDVGRARSMLFITHDIAAAARICDRIAVMYCGEIVECGTTADLLSTPLHPYTRGLIGSLAQRGFTPIPGLSPSLITVPPGCRFSPRCDNYRDCCREVHPPLEAVGTDRYVRCIFHD